MVQDLRAVNAAVTPVHAGVPSPDTAPAASLVVPTGLRDVTQKTPGFASH